jgi:hypothetical protein
MVPLDFRAHHGRVSLVIHHTGMIFNKNKIYLPIRNTGGADITHFLIKSAVS